MSALVARIAPGMPRDRWHIRVPGSKSITNRALLLAGVADGRSALHHPLIADDTLVMAEALRALGATVERGPGVWHVTGLGGPPRGDASVYCGMAGTVGRFLLPMLAAGEGTFTADAHDQLRRRPLGPVMAALRAQGLETTQDSLPMTLHAHGLSGGEVEVDASVSSQFLSGLLLAAPFAAQTTTLQFGELVSAPYLRLTLDVMNAFGVEPEIGEGQISVEPSSYTATVFEVEPDASTASYFLASAALTGTTVTLPGLRREATHQGDIELVDFLEQMGCTVDDGEALTLTGAERLRGVEVDMNKSSDVFMTLACVAPFAEGPTTIGGIGHARVKESDRIAACVENLRRLRVEVEEGQDWVRIHPGTPQTALLPTYDDHRIAMAFSLIGTHVPVQLEDPAVVGKTCPEFFELWGETGADVLMQDL